MEFAQADGLLFEVVAAARRLIRNGYVEVGLKPTLREAIAAWDEWLADSNRADTSEETVKVGKAAETTVQGLTAEAMAKVQDAHFVPLAAFYDGEQLDVDCATCLKPITDDIRYLNRAGEQTHLICPPSGNLRALEWEALFQAQERGPIEGGFISEPVPHHTHPPADDAGHDLEPCGNPLEEPGPPAHDDCPGWGQSGDDVSHGPDAPYWETPAQVIGYLADILAVDYPHRDAHSNCNPDACRDNGVHRSLAFASEWVKAHPESKRTGDSAGHDDELRAAVERIHMYAKDAQGDLENVQNALRLISLAGDTESHDA